MTQAARKRGSVPDWQDSVHVDIGALAQRVTGLEAGMQQIQGAIGDLSKKLDGKPTNWYGIIGVGATVLSVIGGAITMLISPINADLNRHERDIVHIGESVVGRSEYTRHHEELARWLENLRDRVRADEDIAVTRREHDALSKRLDDEASSRLRGDAAIVDQFTKSMEADEHRTDERINTIANGLHDLQHDFYTTHQTIPPTK